MGLISEYLQYRRLKKYYKKLLSWEHQMVEAGLPLYPQISTPYRKGKQ